jgi:hypothetical protein
MAGRALQTLEEVESRKGDRGVKMSVKTRKRMMCRGRQVSK